MVTPFLFSFFSVQRAFVVATESMAPALRIGDIVWVDSGQGTIPRGTIIVFRSPLGGFEVHRVYDQVQIGGRNLYVTKGDALNQTDSFLVTDRMVVGVVSAVVPSLGYYFLMPREIVLSVLMALMGIYVLLSFRFDTEEEAATDSRISVGGVDTGPRSPALVALLLVPMILLPQMMYAESSIRLGYPATQNTGYVAVPTIVLQSGNAGSSQVFDGGNGAVVNVTTDSTQRNSTHYPSSFSMVSGDYVSGSLPDSLLFDDSDYLVSENNPFEYPMGNMNFTQDASGWASEHNFTNSLEEVNPPMNVTIIGTGSQPSNARRTFRNPRGLSYFYVFFYDHAGETNNIYVMKSQDGMIWIEQTPVFEAADHCDQASVWFYDNGTMLIIYAVGVNGGGDLFYRRGLIPDVAYAITWETQQWISNFGGNDDARYPVIARAPDGYVWLVYRYHYKTSKHYYDVESIISTVPDSPTSADWSMRQKLYLATAQDQDNAVPSLSSPAGAHDVAVSWTVGTTATYASIYTQCFDWNGSVLTPGTISPELVSRTQIAMLSTVSDSQGNVHALYTTNSSSIWHSAWEQTSNTWKDTSPILTGGAESLSLGIRGYNDDLYSFYIKLSDQNVWYRKSVDLGASWETEVLYRGNRTCYSVSVGYESTQGRLAVAWKEQQQAGDLIVSGGGLSLPADPDWIEVTWDPANGNPNGSGGGSGFGGVRDGDNETAYGIANYVIYYNFTTPSSWAEASASFAWAYSCTGVVSNNKLQHVKLLLLTASGLLLETLWTDDNGGSGWIAAASLGYFYRCGITVVASLNPSTQYRLAVLFRVQDDVKTDTPENVFRVDDVGLRFRTGAEDTVVEFIITGIPNDVPGLLEVRVTSMYNASSVQVTIQAYNFSSASWPSSGQGWMSYASSVTPNTEETRTLSVASGVDFVSNGEARIRIGGAKAVALRQSLDLVRFDFTGYVRQDYDYVLRVANLGSTSWLLRLSSVSEDSISRLTNVTAWFHDGSGTTRQIQILGGSYRQTTGSDYMLPGSGVVYIALSASASTIGSSYLITVLSARIVGTGITEELPFHINVY